MEVDLLQENVDEMFPELKAEREKQKRLINLGNTIAGQKQKYKKENLKAILDRDFAFDALDAHY